jgi:aminoglycoside 3-N-acetyltransferase
LEKYLFKHDGSLISASDIRDILLSLRADQCDVLYIHTGMQFGMPNLELGRSGILETIAGLLYGLGVSTLIMPSYTFSFCDGQIFDREKTKSSMGALNEYLRVKHHWDRSCDPLMSNILYGKEQGLITQLSKESVGHGSTFDRLSSLKAKVKFLFLGPRINDCFTYMHYLESVKKVPYRYNFNFNGEVIDGERRFEDKYTLYIRDEGVNAGSGSKIYENMLIERNYAKIGRLGGGYISILDLEPSRNLYFELLDMSPNFFLEEVFYKPVRSKIFIPRKMVAL